jgi:GxxExxY protein
VRNDVRGGTEPSRDLIRRRQEMPLDPDPLNEVSGQIVEASYRIHSDLGPGLLETVYETVLAKALENRGLRVERQKAIPIEYEGTRFIEGFRADLVVNGTVVVELKSVEHLLPVHSKKLLTYLRLMDLRLGILVNFGAPVIKSGIKRIVNGLGRPHAETRKDAEPQGLAKAKTQPADPTTSASPREK